MDRIKRVWIVWSGTVPYAYDVVVDSLGGAQSVVVFTGELPLCKDIKSLFVKVGFVPYDTVHEKAGEHKTAPTIMKETYPRIVVEGTWQASDGKHSYRLVETFAQTFALEYQDGKDSMGAIQWRTSNDICYGSLAGAVVSDLMKKMG
jgi:hypothetical protein